MPTTISRLPPRVTVMCRTEPDVSLEERRRLEALRLAVEVAGWSHSASDPDVVIGIAHEFVGFLRGDDEDDDDE